MEGHKGIRMENFPSLARVFKLRQYQASPLLLMDLYQLRRICLLWKNNLIFCIRSWESQRLLPLPLLMLLHNQVHSINLLQPQLYRILTLGSLIQELVIIWPKNPIFSYHIYLVLANKRCRLLIKLLLQLLVDKMCLFHQRLPSLMYCMFQKCLVTYCQSKNLPKPPIVQ